MKYGKPILALLSFWILVCAKHKSSKEIADCYMFIVIDVRCFRISTSGFTSYDTWCSALFSFQRTPAIPSGAVRLSWISFYILPHPFRLVKNFLNLFSQALKAVGDSAAGGSCARGCLPPTRNILHGSMLPVNTFFTKFFRFHKVFCFTLFST